MADDPPGARRQINSPEEAFRYMRRDLDAGDVIQAIVIGDYLVGRGGTDADAVLGLYREALARGLDHGKLHERVWAMEKAAGGHGTYHSGAGQDRFVAETLLAGLDGGVFVDIGGYDGVTASNTLHFEETLGWQGLCVEASPTQFARMARARRVPCVHAAVSDRDGEATLFEITSGYDQMSVLTDAMRPTFMEEFETMRRSNPSEAHEVTVPVTTFSALARAHGLGRVDYCSIDVEGAELPVLRGIDFEATPIRVLSVENPPAQAGTFAAVRAFMTEQGYMCVKTLGEDDIFAKDGV